MPYNGGGGYLIIPPANAYVQEDGVSYYIAENGAYLMQES